MELDLEKEDVEGSRGQRGDALKLKGGARGPRMKVVSRSWKRQRQEFSPIVFGRI